MRITAVTTSVFAGSDDQHVVRVLCESGLTGVSIVRSDCISSVSRISQECLIDADPRATAALWGRMSTCARRDCAADVEAAAALDIALWDLCAKVHGQPLWKWLGGSAPRINAHAIGCSTKERELDDTYAVLNRAGFRAAILKVQGDTAIVDRLRDLAASLRQVRGAPPSLMLQVDQHWAAEEVIQRVGAIEREFDITWVECPALSRDFRALKRISKNVRAAVCSGATLSEREEWRSYFSERCVDVVQIDVRRCGFSGAMQIADAAFGFELPVVLSASPGNIGAHIAAVMPYCMSVEVDVADTSESNVRVEDGWLIAGHTPGHGFDPTASLPAEHVASRA